MNSTEDPLVSILIPVYNMGEYVEQAILSVITGDYQNLEIVIVDDGSTDNTKQIVQPYVTSADEKYDNRVQYLYKKNGGKSSALNLGLSHFQGEFLVVLDADDELTKNSIYCRLDEARSNQNTKRMIIGGFEVFESGNTVGKRPVPQNLSAAVLSRKFYFSLKTPFHMNACLISRELVDAVGNFDERLIRCQDGDYAIRCLQQAQHVSTVNEMVYRYRKHRSSPYERIVFRLRTARHRTRVINKNFYGFRKIMMVPGCLAIDGLKLVFELFGNFKR